ncbi:hypothetical protein EIZ48_29125 [Photobacterium alginatilyticum]|uniref:Uncharacterized protein n=1 Tax=Photobacterium alginatilyticum TaxID=1775171 RepID=A0ABW9YS44_9GAMM|nr:hypothetical protein [Photobacterium alginatilyticum]
MMFQLLLTTRAQAESSARRTKPINLAVRYTEKRSGISPETSDLIAAKLDPQTLKRTPRCLCF